MSTLVRLARYGAIAGFLFVSSGCVVAPDHGYGYGRDARYERDQREQREELDQRDHRERHCEEHDRDCRDQFH